ncbi:MAG: prephenate dehydrogenase/arogenate dehydrogenase family protein [Acidimicrobiia bacterium]|nr:prephenate dehydrogenase/arogenate dehydrogenase family protein [Acidimicrobiia bacterium]MYG94194.1 prephenate dehydrogenase/arogenate dehydrogenase family protein [Acidimicrobiia bacterium]MYI30459.1 prephenate dehydrogenase/arogenate dehydrogenase family protein [Acidimicrobiia bacterium]
MACPMANTKPQRRAAVVGTGLIGGSIGLALREQGWWVTGCDQDGDVAAQALARGALSEIGLPVDAEITFVSTPVASIVAEVRKALAANSGLVTDVGGVKTSIVADVDDPRFLGGHPMAGSEQEGIAGARADLFQNAVWVLTPTDKTDDDTLVKTRSVVASLNADVMSLAPERHDALVAVVSHVPHLTAATLMALADDRSEEHRAMLRLAAGGFRDMTRIASGHPGIWPDICKENAEAICITLDRFIGSLQQVRSLVAEGNHNGLLQFLEQARHARSHLPYGLERHVVLAEVRIAVFDRPGELARITSLTTEIGVNIYDLEIAHSVEGGRGVAIMVVDNEKVSSLLEALREQGYAPSVRLLETSSLS